MKSTATTTPSEGALTDRYGGDRPEWARTYSVTEAAYVVRRSKSWMYERLRSKQVNGVRMQGATRIREQDLKAYMQGLPDYAEVSE